MPRLRFRIDYPKPSFSVYTYVLEVSNTVSHCYARNTAFDQAEGPRYTGIDLFTRSLKPV